MSKRLQKNAPCPCESGKQYGKCCWEKGFEFVINEEGEIGKRVKLNKQTKEIIENQMVEFEAILGRKPGDHEPIFFQKLLVSDKMHNQLMDEMFHQIGVEEDKIYASKKTGLIIVSDHLDKFSDKDLESWNEAIDEYWELKETGKLDELTVFDVLESSFQRVQFIYALIITKRNGDQTEINLDTGFDPLDYVYLCLTKNLKTFLAYQCIIENYYNEDSMALIRSMYENYLRIIAIRNDVSFPDFRSI